MSRSRGNLIAGNWLQGSGERFTSIDPATGSVVWEGKAADGAQVDLAIAAARQALDRWSATPLADRLAALDRFAQQLLSNKVRVAESICQEVGKPRWEALTEVEAMIGKVAISKEAYENRCRTVVSEQGGVAAATRFKPHGCVAVFGPFNFPGHLPNGHIVPALLAGNTVVFKPSELTPGVAELIAELWVAANLPPGVFNLVQGARDTGKSLASHPGIDGLFFTGSAAVGLALSRALTEHPSKILALEMGGNNPLIIWQAQNLDAAAYLTIQSAYITSGQRCSCARRLIIPAGPQGDALIDRLVTLIAGIRIGPSTNEPEPFMGPVVNEASADKLLLAQQALRDQGGRTLVEMKQIGSSPAMLSPGLLDVTAVPNRPDEELFGPLLQVVRVEDFAEAIREANHTRFGLCAGLLSDSRELYEQFYRMARAGVIYWNRQTTGASSRLPFGGLGLSGNHRPSAYLAADYCAYPVASMESEVLTLPATKMPGLP